MDPDKSLTRVEFDAVMRRATELALGDPDAGTLTEAELFRIAREVGVPDQHVRAALAEVRSGEESTGALVQLFGMEVVLASRVVQGTPEDLLDQIDGFLVGGRLLQPVRRGATFAEYRPAVDWISQVARLASATSRRYFMASARSVEVKVEELEGGVSLVAFRVDPGTRGEAIAGAAVGGGTGGVGGGVGLAVALATIAPLGVAVAAGVALGVAVGGGVTWAVGRSHQRKLRDVKAEVEGLLDQLELGRPLEPPPPSWQHWVRRNFHGARRLLDDVVPEPPPKREASKTKKES